VSVVCPQGHTSESEDYCDVCGSPIESAGAPAAAEANPAASQAAEQGPVACPNCDFPAAPNALFCENCGYDFTTGTAPQPAADPNPLSLDALAAPAGGAAAAAEPAAEQAEEPAGPPEPAEAEEPTNGTALPTPPTPGPDTWVAEMWVDPDWYASQQPEDPMPSPGSPQVVPLRERSVLVGRPSASRNIHPQVDAGADTGVSRRHCQLSTDGQRWWVEDLGSANGTYVSLAGEPLPTTPLDVGIRHELVEGERVFLGGWTRLVVRKALPGEA
jgi:hypothetical protein